jgi:hypothetical protein
VIEPHWHGTVKSVQIEQGSFGCGINQPWPLASLQINNDAKTIHEHVLLEGWNNFLSRQVASRAHKEK